MPRRAIDSNEKRDRALRLLARIIADAVREEQVQRARRVAQNKGGKADASTGD